MPFTPFHFKFPEIADKEIRSFEFLKDVKTPKRIKIPKGNYRILEYYCDEPDCDCRRVFLNVLSEETREILAVISFGWESEKFYAKWMNDGNATIGRDYIGPMLVPDSKQSEYAPGLLKIVERMLDHDPDYVKLLQRHYNMFRETIDGVSSKKAPYHGKKTGRNEPCPCGSGKKYKKCCGKR
jgi:SEC-C motif-containing protein